MTTTVHFVGSVPLPTADDTFRALAALGSRAPRLPDGEPGNRQNWIMSQHAVFERTGAFVRYEEAPDSRAPGVKRVRYRLRPGAAAPDAERLGPLGYAAGARESFATFGRLKHDGVIGPAARFQVSIPSPYDIVGFNVDHADYAKVYPVYERAVTAEVARIAALVPHQELAIQWDVAHEFEYLASKASPPFVPITRDEVVALLVRLGEAVPADIELGFHCCYGDYNHKHFIEPRDTSDMVDVMNRVAARVGRRVEFVHMPVPRNRSDAAYFAPLKKLKLRPETQLYLGLVHFSDGLSGAKKRIAAARKAIKGFGIATECGLGRRKAETIPELLGIHAQAASFMDGA
jgi:hypothetical protein